MDFISKVLRMPEYYLDTVAVRKLSNLLSEGRYNRILTSIFTIVELIGNVKDERSFQRQKSILAKLARGKFIIDPYLPEIILQNAFNIPVMSDVSDQILEMMLRLISFDSYPKWLNFEKCRTPHPNIYEYVRITDEQKTFAQMLEKNGLKIQFNL